MDEEQARMARCIHGLPIVSPGPTMPEPSTPCGRTTPETALRRGLSKRVEDGRRPPALWAGYPRNGCKAGLVVACPQGIEGSGMAGPGETSGSPWIPLPYGPVCYSVKTFVCRLVGLSVGWLVPISLWVHFSQLFVDGLIWNLVETFISMRTHIWKTWS
jgi:hypothetical protein